MRLFVLATLVPALAIAAVDPIALSHHGLLLGTDDAPVDGTTPLTFRIVNTRNPGDLQEQVIWTSNACDVVVHKGFYAVVLGTECTGTAPLTPDLLAPSAPRFLEISVGATALKPRLAIIAAPNALLAARATDADKLQGAARTDFWERTSDLAESKYGAGTLAAKLTALEAKIPGVGQTGELPTSVIPSLDAAKISTGTIGLARGGTGTDLSATGGPAQVLRQSTVGGPITVSALTTADLPPYPTTPLFIGATASAAGSTGTTPAPLAGENTKFLRGDGSWVDVPSPWSISGADTLRPSGNVGIGVAAPKAKLDVGGTIKIGTATTCNADAEGSIRYNATTKSVQVCNGTAWASVTGQAPRTCKEVLDQGVGATDGNYQLDPDGPATVYAPFTAYCDMSINNGGWTLALNLDTADGRIQWYNVTNFWTSDTYNLGTDNAPFGGDYKRAAIFAGINATQVMIRVHKNGTTVGWRVWNVNIPNRSLSSYFNGGSNVRLTGGVAAADVSNIQAREALIKLAGELDLNRSVGANDLNRVWNTATTASDNNTGGLGTFYDTTSGECSRPCADALAVTGTDTWGLGLMGSDTDSRNQYGSNSGYDYDYAIYVR